MKKIEKQVQKILKREFDGGEQLPPGEFDKGNCIKLDLKTGDPFYIDYHMTCKPEIWMLEINQLIVMRANELIEKDWLAFLTENEFGGWLCYPFEKGNIFQTRFFEMDDFEYFLGRLDKLRLYIKGAMHSVKNYRRD